MSDLSGLQIKPVSQSSVFDYANLLSQSFRGFKPSVEYLSWLYFENPRGQVRGFDAFDGEKIVAHYACVPIKIFGYKNDSLLSLNTATHPDYQGRGLFSALASKTFESVSTSFANVLGVANAKSVGGFVKHLGFEKIGNLDLRVGSLKRATTGSRIYSKNEIEWRASCPRRELKISERESNSYLVSARISRFLPELKAIVPVEFEHPSKNSHLNIGMTLDWRRGVKPIVKLPVFMKPSPLELIYKPLLEIDSSKFSSFSFPDFDAY
jgi:GNAT superfamily N-acetyltransferase